MTSLRNIPVAESAVYRNIHKKPQENAFHQSSFTDVRGRHVHMEASKWAFLKRLMAIEEAHDKRRRARERQEKSLRLAKLKLPSSPVDKVRPQLEENESDPMSKWLNGQILAESSDDTLDMERPDSSNRDLDSYQLPPSSEQFRPLSSRKQRQHPPTLTGNHHNHVKEDFSGYPDRSFALSPTNSVHRAYFDQEHQPLSQLSHRESARHAVGQHDNQRHPVSSSLDRHESSVSRNTHYSSSRPATSSKSPRRLRLPPILLPRVHTNRPRPLKCLEFPAPTKMPGPITEAEWDDLRDCRYIRHVTSRKHLQKVKP